MKCCTDIYGPQRMYLNGFGNPDFPVAPPAGQHFHLSHTLLLWEQSIILFIIIHIILLLFWLPNTLVYDTCKNYISTSLSCLCLVLI